MRQFYCEYVNKPNLQPLVAEISWTKNLIILSRCKDDLEREFYLRATARYGWTKAVLQHQVDNKSYEKYLLNQTNFDMTVPDEIKAQAALAVKDEHSERDLEQALVKNLRGPSMMSDEQIVSSLQRYLNWMHIKTLTKLKPIPN